MKSNDMNYISYEEAIRRDEDLVLSWHTTEPLSVIATRLGMTAESVRTRFRRLAEAGRLPAAARAHVPRDKKDRGDESPPISVGSDPLLAKLIEVHGKWSI